MTIRKIIPAQPGSQTVYHQARWIIIDPWNIIENGCIEVQNGFITGIHRKIPPVQIIDHGPGVLMSPLVNAHLHLELSALKNQLSFGQGFDGWVKQLLEKREDLSRQDMIQAVREQAKHLVQNGNLWIGDIASLDIVEPLVSKLSLKGVYFQEFLGTQIPDICNLEKDMVSFSVAGHAPHTTSPNLLTQLKKRASSHGLMFSIHLAESDLESEFICEQNGHWADFLHQRGIDFSAWQIKAKTPVEHAANIGLLGSSTLAVHLLNVTSDDLDLLARTQSKICLCPRSNKNLHQKLPDIYAMFKSGLKPALGTDSLASCDSLDIFDEMAFVLQHFPFLAPPDILAMGTVNGARALGFQTLTGSLEKGKLADMIYLSCQARTKNTLVEKIISNEY